MKPFFSIVIPTYNQANFLKKCLNSVFKQTFKNFEVIIIDNSSTDHTKEIISKYKKKIVYKKISNQGVIAKSRNIGIKNSNGHWVAFLDSDDTWKKNKLERVFKTIQKNNFEVFCNSEWFVKKNKTSRNIPGPYENNFYKKLLLIGNRLSTSASVVNRSFINKNKILFPESKKFISSEDYFFFLEIARLNGIFFFYKKPLGHHFFHEKSSSFNENKHLKAEIEVLKHHILKKQEFTKKKVSFLTNAIEYRKIKIEMIFLIKKIYKVENIIKLLLLILLKPIKFFVLLKILIKNKSYDFFYKYLEFSGM